MSSLRRSASTTQVRKRHFLSHLYIKVIFYQDRLGTNIEKPPKKARFLEGFGYRVELDENMNKFAAIWCEKTASLSRNLLLKASTLPRQARDKHRWTALKKRATMFRRPDELSTAEPMRDLGYAPQVCLCLVILESHRLY